MSSTELLEVARRLKPSNVATVARLCAKAREGTLTDEQFYAIYQELRRLPCEHTPLEAEVYRRARQLGALSYEVRRYTLGETVLACTVLVPEDQAEDPIDIARQYIIALGDLVLFAAEGVGVH